MNRPTCKGTPDESASMQMKREDCDGGMEARKVVPGDRFVEPVFVRFGKEDQNLPPGAIQLILDDCMLDRPFPWDAKLVADRHEGGRWNIDRVHVEIFFKGEQVPAEIDSVLRAAAVARSAVQVPDHWQLFTWFRRNRDYREFANGGPWRAEQVLRSVGDLVFARATGYKPAWYDVHDHAALFEDPDESDFYVDDDLEDAYVLFGSAEFKRGSDGQRLARRLEQIEPGRFHARAFHHWVAEAIGVLFREGFERIRERANGTGPLQRDIVATNSKKGPFSKRIYDDYDVSMAVFEVKNYEEPESSDFAQVERYLGANHFGSLGFLVVHAPTKVLSQATWRQTRTSYNRDGKRKLVLVVPSAFLLELLDNLWWDGSGKAQEAMVIWLEDVLLGHLEEE